MLYCVLLLSFVMTDLATQHLNAAQDYLPRIELGKRSQHPIEAIRDDILMNKYDINGNLRLKRQDQYASDSLPEEKMKVRVYQGVGVPFSATKSQEHLKKLYLEQKS